MAKVSEFGRRLKTAFNNATNGVIARQLGVAETTVGFYVRGRIPDAEKLIEIANLTNRSIDWLLTGRDNEQSDEYERKIFDEGLLIEKIAKAVERENQKKSVSQIAQDEGFRDMMRELVQEEIAKTRKRSRYVEIDFGHGEEQNKKTG